MMGKLNDIYPIAIEQTKQKVNRNIERYLESHEVLPDFENYITEKSAYLNQIWIDVWVNMASNDIPKKEKKAFLTEVRLLSTSDEVPLGKLQINKLFRNAIKTYQPFNVPEWLNEKFSKYPEKWERRYVEARDELLKRQGEQKAAEKRWIVQTELQKEAHTFFNENSPLLYVHVRYHVAQKLAVDFQNKPKFKYIEPFMLEEPLQELGAFDTKDYLMFSDFFEELTGNIHSLLNWGKNHYEYETYYYRYEKIIKYFISEMSPRKVVEQLPSRLQNEFLKAYGEQITAELLKEYIHEEMNDLTEACMSEFQKEYLADILKLTLMPFDETKHLEIFENDVKDRQRRIDAVLAEQARMEREKERIIDDIFGKAYMPTLGRSRKYVLHIGETNSGKTYQALQRMKEANSGWYLAPLRLLALEVFDKLNADGVACSLKTGEEEKLKEGAKHISSTVEMFHEKDRYEVIVIDEAQMIADKDRGFSWYQAIMKANADEVHIIGSNNIKPMLFDLLGEANIELREYTRDIPLEVETMEFSLKYTKKGDALVCFSRKRVLETASLLQRSGHSVSVIYGSMPPENRKRQIERFNRGDATVVVATDAIGMGLNLPIQRIVILENEKFDGTHRRRLTSQEVKQIAGRAGRKGIYNTGKVAFTSDIEAMRRLLEQEDEHVQIFAIAPTSSVFERFLKYFRNMGLFFELWNEFDPPKGTKKASLSQERDLYDLIRDTEIEHRFSLLDLYGFLHLPFSGKEQLLVHQWLLTIKAIAEGGELPDPVISTNNLEELELAYKAIGLHLLFLYRLNRRTEAVYWERIRQEISNGVTDHLKEEVINYQKKCKRCGKKLPDDSRFAICDACHHTGFRNTPTPRSQKRWR